MPQRIWMVALALVWFPAVSLAQQQPQPPKKLPPKIERVQIGFKTLKEDSFQRMKVGLWTPIYVTVFPGTDGFPPKDHNGPPAQIQVETTDSETVGTIYRTTLPALPPLEPGQPSPTFVTYTKTGAYNGEVRVSIVLNDRQVLGYPPMNTNSPPLGGQMYLCLGNKIPDLQTALDRRGNRQDFKDREFDGQNVRFGAYEDKVPLLPDHWFGYQAMDLVFLSTSKADFLQKLKGDKDRLQALSQWVRQGGRLVIPVHWQTQADLNALLSDPTWQPPVPVKPPADPGDVLQNSPAYLPEMVDFAGVQGSFPKGGEKPVPLAKLDPGNLTPGSWKILKATYKGDRALIARIPYGQGSISLIAFSLDQGPFIQWPGKANFLHALLNLLGGREPQGQQFFDRSRKMGDKFDDDITSSLQQTMDSFDVTVVSFGYVALFIIIYILLVGPLDYFVLKYVFKRLEWTWFTFPTVVLAVSVGAYFTAYALKGDDLKINKIDVIDFDLRSDLDELHRPRRAFVNGTSFFTILSPRIQSYTIGVTSNPAFWNGKEETPASAMPVSWLGRPDHGFDGMGNRGATGLFRKPYTYAPEAEGLLAVPIPVWTTKSFTASFSADLKQMPLKVDLVYQPDDRKEQKILGTLHNRLAADLEDVWLIYGGKAYPVETLRGTVAKGEPVKLALTTLLAVDFNNWNSTDRDPQPQKPGGKAGLANPTSQVKQILFHDKGNVGNNQRNHSVRGLDMSWRVEPEPSNPRDKSLREAILYARVYYTHGSAKDLAKDPNLPLPSTLWLGDVPGPNKTPPDLIGNMGQFTYVRFILPLRPQEN